MTGNLNGERRCPDDLVVRGQREHLNQLEAHALAVHLAQCAECRTAAALSALFDAVPEAQPGDDDLIARVADRAVGKPRRTAPWATLRVAAVVALVVLTGGVATAALVAYRRSAERSAAESSPVRSPVASPPPPPVLRLLPQKAGAEPDDPAVVLAEPPRVHRPSAPVPAPMPAPRQPTAETPTAASLFSEANSVRRSGDVRRAISLYQALRQHFPDSSQAMLSAISVGELLLDSGDAVGAIEAYADYLGGAPNGFLIEEALYGRARGLGMLGRKADERRTLEELVRRFPRSAYQPFASRRLRELAP